MRLLQKLQIVKWEREIWALLTLNCTADGRRSLTLGVKHVQLCRPSAFRAGSWHHLQRPAACEKEHDIWIIVKGLSDLERSSEMSSVAGIPAPADNKLLSVFSRLRHLSLGAYWFWCCYEPWGAYWFWCGCGHCGPGIICLLLPCLCKNKQRHKYKAPQSS